jgi:hypothetical protein
MIKRLSLSYDYSRPNIKKKNDFILLCKSHNVKYLYAFGSSTDERFDPLSSNIDLLVEIDSPDPIDRGEKLLSLWDLFEDSKCR